MRTPMFSESASGRMGVQLMAKARMKKATSGWRLMACLSDDVEAGWVVVSVAMVVLLAGVTVLCASVVVLLPAGVVAGWMVS